MATTEKLVAFKHGPQSRLTGSEGLNVTKTAVEGTFYLTDDSYRLYIGTKEGTVVPVNEGVTIVDDVAKLPTPTDPTLEVGHFYYVSPANILCVYNGEQWVQINPDTNTDTTNKSLNITLTGDTTNNSVSADIAVTDSTTASVRDQIIYAGANGVKVTGQTTVTDTNKANKIVTIAGDTYTLTKTVEAKTDQQPAKAILQLSSTNAGNNSSITLTGTGGLHITEDADHNIQLESDDTQVDTLTIDASTSTPNKYHLVVGNSNSDEKSIDFGATIFYGKDADVGATLQKNDSYILDIYSKDDIDAKLKNELQKLDAMRFKGTVGQDGTVTELPAPANKVEKGDTYKVSSNDYLYIDGSKIDHNNIIADKAKAVIGDVFIANGNTEDDEGFLPTITWVYIPSGDDNNNTTYLFTPLVSTSGPGSPAGGGGIKVSSSDDPTSDAYRHIFDTDDNITGSGLVISTVTGENNKNGITRISHKSPSELIAHTEEISDTTNHTLLSKTTQEEFGRLAISVPNYEYDKFGHLTKKTMTVYTVVDSVPNLVSSAENTIANAETTVTLGLVDTIGGQNTRHNGFIKFKSSSLVVSADTDTANHTGIVGIDMYWGSF